MEQKEEIITKINQFIKEASRIKSHRNYKYLKNKDLIFNTIPMKPAYENKNIKILNIRQKILKNKLMKFPWF